MEKTTKQTSEEKKTKQNEIALLDSWHSYIENAMINLHKKFLSDTKFILTESDLKCWLFYFLQEEKNNNKSVNYSVHTEITHFAPHLVKGRSNKSVIELKKKYKYRDLTLLNPNNLKVAEEIWDENIDAFINSKGFKHQGPAIHFELKMIRQSRQVNQESGLIADIDKLSNYKPAIKHHIRDFVIVCGSRSYETYVENLKNAVKENINNIKDNSVKERLRFYLFDREKIVCGKWVKNEIEF